MTDDDLITDRVVDTAKRIEDMTDPDEIDPLEVKVEASLDGTPKAFTAVLGTGGPHIEVDVTNGVVRGSWGSDKHTTHVRNEELLDQLDARYHEMWEMQLQSY